MKNFTQKFIGILALVFTMNFTVNSQEIGDVFEGGYIYQINEDGTCLLADLEDLGGMNWDGPIDAAASATSQGYDDWYLANLEELELMYNTIWNRGSQGNIGGLGEYYWSSSELDGNFAWDVDFSYGGTGSFDKTNADRVRIIRTF